MNKKNFYYAFMVLFNLFPAVSVNASTPNLDSVTSAQNINKPNGPIIELINTSEYQQCQYVCNLIDDNTKPSVTNDGSTLRASGDNHRIARGKCYQACFMRLFKEYMKNNGRR